MTYEAWRCTFQSAEAAARAAYAQVHALVAENAGLHEKLEARCPGLVQIQEPAETAAPVVLPEPTTTIISIDEFGPCFGWLEHWAKFPVGTKLFSEQQVRALLAATCSLVQEVYVEFIKDGMGGDFEDGEHPLADRVRAFLACAAVPAAPAHPVEGVQVEMLSALQAVAMDAVGVGGGENTISDSARAKVEAVLEKVGAPWPAVAQGVPAPAVSEACAQDIAEALEKAKQYDRLQPYLCKTCRGYGAVGNIITAEPCAECTPDVAAPTVPEAWRLVPVKDNPAMWTAGGKAIKACGGHERDAASLAWAAMLAAAPQITVAQAEDARDAARWREALMHVGAVNHLGGQHFTFNTLTAPPGSVPAMPSLMRGSVAQHFSKAIDASIAAKAAKGMA